MLTISITLSSRDNPIIQILSQKGRKGPNAI